MKKQTAAEWLYAHLLPFLELDDPKKIHHYKLCLNEAILMEKEQIIDAYCIGKYINVDDREFGEKYFNETYKQTDNE